MGFSPLKLQNPHKTWKELSTAGALSRAAKDGAQHVTRCVKAAALFLPNLKDQVFRGDPSKPVRWIDASRKAQRHELRDQRKAARKAAEDAEREVRMAVRLAIKTQLALEAQAPAKPLPAAPHGAAHTPTQAEAIARVDAALSTYAQVLRGDMPEAFDSREFDHVALMALRRLRDDKSLSESDFARFAEAGDGFSTESAADRDKRFSPSGGEADPARRLCEATIGEAWRRLMQGQWGRQGEQQPIRVDAVAASGMAHPAPPDPVPVEAAPDAGAALLKEIEHGAKQAFQQWQDITDRLFGGGQESATHAFAQDGSGPTQEAPAEASVPAVTSLDGLEGGAPPATVGSTTPPAKEPVKPTREERLAQVDKAWAAYGMVLGGELPEGAKTSLDAETLQRLASDAMLKLQDAGWITPTDVARFDAPKRFITQETRDERAERFIPGDAPNRVAARQLCEVAIGQAWARAYGVDKGSAPVEPFTISEWRKRGAPVKAAPLS